MATKVEDMITENLATLSPTDFEVLDIYNLSTYSSQYLPPDKPATATMMGFPQKSLDQELIEATMTVLKTGKLTPLIKEELKCTIQNRRLARGEEELRVDLSPPTVSHTLSPEEQASLDDKKRARRERNRVAALKCRRKKRQQQMSQAEECRLLDLRNSELKQKLEQMQQERDILIHALSEVTADRAYRIDVGGACSPHDGIGGAWSVAAPDEVLMTASPQCTDTDLAISP